MQPALQGEESGESGYQRRVEIGHGDGKAQIDKAGDPMIADAAGDDACEMAEVGFDIDRDAMKADPAAQLYADGGDFTEAWAVVSDLGEPGAPYRHIAGQGAEDRLVNLAALERWR